MAEPRFKVGDIVWIREDMGNKPGHEALADRGYRIFIRPVEVEEVLIFKQDQCFLRGLFCYHLGDSEEPLGYWKSWTDRNTYATQEDAINDC